MLVPLAKDVWTLVGIIIAWQLTLNMMLGPLAAWAGDCVPDDQKGLLGGLLAFSPALGAWSGALVTWPGLVSGESRLIVIALLVASAVLPVLLLGRSEEHTSELQSLMRNSYAVFCLKKTQHYRH